MNAIIEKQSQDHKNIHRLYADAEKCFEKLCLKYSLIEMVRTGYNKNDRKMLCEINKITEIVVGNAIGNTQSIEIKEVVKQGLIVVPTMSCATTAKVNNVGEKVDFKYGEIEIGMSIYMDDISGVGGPEEVKKWNRKMCKNGSGKKKRNKG